MLKRFTSLRIRLLCLLPFMISVLLPVGVMPTINGDGSITLIICTVHGPEERSFPSHNEEPEGAASWCPFSLLGSPAVPLAPIDWVNHDTGEIVDIAVSIRDVPMQRDVHVSKPRGPPSIL